MLGLQLALDIKESKQCLRRDQSRVHMPQKQWSSWDRVLPLSQSAPRRWICSTALYAQVLLGESWSPRSADTGLQAHRRDKLKPETVRPTNTRDKQMTKGKHKNLTNSNQGYLSSSEPSLPTTASPGYPNTPEKQDLNLKITSHDADRGLEEGQK